MTDRRLAVVLFIVLALAWGGCCSPQKLASVNVRLIPQHRDCWCWAASTEMISEYYGHRVDQCESANFVHGTPPDCCTGCKGDCPGWGWAWGASITDIKNNWTHWKFSYDFQSSALTWDNLKKTISTSKWCCSSPVMVIWWWTGGGGHVVVAYGYVEIGSQNYVSYNNPWPPDCQKVNAVCSPVPGGEDAVTTYKAFVNDGSHTWGDSFYNFKFTGP
jgi:hypothetical protein